MTALARQAAPRYGSAAAVAAYAGVSLKTVRRLIARGDVRGLKVGRRTLVPFADVDRHIERGSATMATIHRTGPAERAGPLVPALGADELTRSNRDLLALLESWERDGDEREQRETLAVLDAGIAERRASSRVPAP